MLNCEQATLLLSESMERKLTLQEQASLRFHTLMCSSCRRFGTHIQDIRTAIRADKQSAAEKNK